MSKGLRITRRFTEAGKDAYDRIEWSRRDSRINNPDGSIVFEMTDAETLVCTPGRPARSGWVPMLSAKS